ncbi:hypothetical protein J2T22_001648 [Pseudarthrobacter defluvii]|uniref:HNH endonuclease n=1 Tax=Pseudarthrobacter defluvii TaxID=410837 RepID=A0ABT9UFP7_9MICC|nr:hypothetical protein [Pseudarthrobacter defluvii]MDQ0118470.1 hypothetical protein [Pseudarthrobacter defluvii]
MKPQEVPDNHGLQERDQFINKTIRDWANGAGVPVADKGAIPKTVRAAWIEAHQGLNNPVIWHWLEQDDRDGRWVRGVDILCYHCAKMHRHGGWPGVRLAPEENHRSAHCGGENRPSGGYYFEDTVPVDENEKAMAEANAALDAKR